MGNSALLKTSLALQCVLEPLSECTDLKVFGHAPATETLALLFVDPGGTRNPTLHPEHSVHPSDRQTVSKASLPPSIPLSIRPFKCSLTRNHRWPWRGGLGERRGQRSGEGPFSQLVWTRQRL